MTQERVTDTIASFTLLRMQFMEVERVSFTERTMKPERVKSLERTNPLERVRTDERTKSEERVIV